MRKFLCVVCAATLAVVMASCASMFYKPVFVLSLHEFSDVQGSRLTIGVKDTSRKYSRKVMKYGFVTARNITSAEAYGPAENGKYGVRLTLDVWGLNDIRATAGSNRGTLYAILLDGEYIDCAHFGSECYDGEVFVVEPVFTQYVADMIVKHAEQNRDYFNRQK